MIELDKILEDLNRVTRRQWIQLSILMIPCVLVASQMGAMVFLGADMEHKCRYPEDEQLLKICNETLINKTEIEENISNLDVCKRYDLSNIDCSYNELETHATLENFTTIPCSSWVYNTSQLFTSTVVSEFDLVCSASYQRHLSQSILMMGVTIGCVVWGQVSDRKGRKFSITMAVAIGTVFAICVAFTNSFTLFVTLRSLSAFCHFGAFSSSYVLATEIVKPKDRVRVGQTCQAFFALGFCLLAMYGYFVRDWRNLQLVLSIPFLGMLSFYWLLFESPRWLVSRKRYKEADVIIQNLITSAKLQQQPIDAAALNQLAKGEKKDENAEEDIGVNHQNNYGPLDLVRTPNMRSKSLKLFYCWLVCSCVYYGLTLNSADLGGDAFINLFLSGFVEIPAVFICMIILEKWGRRMSTALTLMLSGVACITMWIVPKEMLWLNITCSLIGKSSIAAAFSSVYIYAAELYPTPVRNVGMGLCSSFARIGGILSPFIGMLGEISAPLPYVVFGLMSIVGGFLVLFLPEVVGTRLPETLQEGEEFGLDQKGPMDKLRHVCCKKNSEETKERKMHYSKVLNQDA